MKEGYSTTLVFLTICACAIYHASCAQPADASEVAASNREAKAANPEPQWPNDAEDEDEEFVNYSGWEVFKISRSTAFDSSDEDEFEERILEFEADSEVRVLGEHQINGQFDIAISPRKKDRIIRKLENKDLTVEKLETDLGELIELPSQRQRSELPKGTVTFDQYMTYDQMVDFFFEFTKQNPKIVKHSIIGKSVEGRDIHMLTLTMNRRQQREAKQLDESLQTEESEDEGTNTDEKEEMVRRHKIEEWRRKYLELVQYSGKEPKIPPHGMLTNIDELQASSEEISGELEDIEDALSSLANVKTTSSESLESLEDGPKDTMRLYEILQRVMDHKPIQLTPSVSNSEDFFEISQRIAKSFPPEVRTETFSDAETDIIYLLSLILPDQFDKNKDVVLRVRDSLVELSKVVSDLGGITEGELESKLSLVVLNGTGILGITSGVVSDSGKEYFNKVLNIIEIIDSEKKSMIPGSVLKSDMKMNDTSSNNETMDAAEPDTRIKMSDKPVILIDGGIHAREWISPAFVLYLLTQLVSDTSLLLGAEWQVIPMLNPDGYVHSWKKDRLWRKNRSVTEKIKRRRRKKCYGVDLNRNFGFKFGGSGASSNPCSQVYHGKEAFSEPESQALRSVVQASKLRIKAYVTVHSYGQKILYPWGYEEGIKHPKCDMMRSMANGMAKAIQRVHGKEYKVGQPSSAAAGASDDYVSSEGVDYSYTLELRPTGRPGFMLRSSKIQPTVEETWAAVKYMGDRITSENIKAYSRDRLWRKNRSAKKKRCRGVDLNRNFGYKFGGDGTSNNPCSQVYHGGAAFSEPESQALRSVVQAYKPRIKAYVTVHNYGQMILHPWGYSSRDKHPKRDIMRSMGKGMAEAIRSVHGKKYEVGSAAGVLYAAAGGSDDYVSSEGVDYSYTFELRDHGRYAFTLPSSQIKPTVEETWAAIKYMGDRIISENVQASPRANVYNELHPVNIYPEQFPLAAGAHSIPFPKSPNAQGPLIAPFMSVAPASPLFAAGPQLVGNPMFFQPQNFRNSPLSSGSDSSIKEQTPQQGFQNSNQYSPFPNSAPAIIPNFNAFQNIHPQGPQNLRVPIQGGQQSLLDLSQFQDFVSPYQPQFAGQQPLLRNPSTDSENVNNEKDEEIENRPEPVQFNAFPYPTRGSLGQPGLIPLFPNSPVVDQAQSAIPQTVPMYQNRPLLLSNAFPPRNQFSQHSSQSNDRIPSNPLYQGADQFSLQQFPFPQNDYNQNQYFSPQSDQDQQESNLYFPYNSPMIITPTGQIPVPQSTSLRDSAVADSVPPFPFPPTNRFKQSFSTQLIPVDQNNQYGSNEDLLRISSFETPRKRSHNRAFQRAINSYNRSLRKMKALEDLESQFSDNEDTH